MRLLDQIKFRPSNQLLLPWHPGRSISVSKAAKLLGCSTSTVLRLIQSGDIQAYKLNFKKENSPYRVRFESVYKFVEKLREHNGFDPVPDNPDAPVLSGTSSDARVSRADR